MPARMRVSLQLLSFVATAVLLSPVASAAAFAQGPADIAISGLKWREIGPAIMGGRVTDLAVVDANPAIFYVGTATGGLWKTINHGTSFTPIFDDQSMSSIGDVTLAPSNPNVVWVGSGEPQNRQSSPWGNGVYRSTDAGRTWSHLGLTETLHISKILVHPNDPDVAFVGALGHLWGENEERGVYKTTDGGATWNKVLYLDENTGVIDLAMDPGDPNTIFAAMYQRRRTGFGFNGGGPGSGIYRTTDGGATWTEQRSGLPEGDLGRIGLDIYRRDGNIVYAQVEARPGSGVYRSVDRGETWEFMSDNNNRPMYYSMIRIDPNDPERIYTGGSNLFRSSDGGNNFTPDAASEVHSDHHALWINPANSDHLILGGDGGVDISWDRSDSWRQLRNLPLAQFYEIGVDMRDPYYVCGGLQDNGSWCAPSQTLSNQGVRNRDWYNVHGGDGFYTVMDPNDPMVMFAESQGGRVSRVDLNTMERLSITPVARPTDEDEDRRYRGNWNTPIVLSVHDQNVVYLGYNHLLKSNDRGMSWQEISPDLTKQIDRSEIEIMGESEDRMLSRHDGISNYGNMTTVGESPLNASLIYVGTDDGNVHVTRDGGGSWTDLTPRFRDLPERTYASKVVPSAHDEALVYAVFDGHQNDDYSAYAYVSEDYGENWRSIVTGLPDGWSLNVLAEHPRNPNLLFIGNEIGIYFSIDRGEEWVRLKSNLPTVPVDDIKVHPRDNDLVIGTHGRGAWILHDITPLEELTSEVLNSTAQLFGMTTATLFNAYRPQGWTPGVWEAPNPPAGARIRYFLNADESAEEGDEPTVQVTVTDAHGDVVRELTGPGSAGIHEVIWDLRMAPPYVPNFGGTPNGPRVMPGSYSVNLDAGGSSFSRELTVRLDPRVEITRADLIARQHALLDAYALAKPLYEARSAIQELNRQLADIQGLLGDQEDAPAALSEEATTILDELNELNSELSQVSRLARAGGSVEGSTTKPTEDQLWQIERAWEQVPDLISRLNAFVTGRVPAFYARLNENGIRPDPGEAVSIPVRPGN